MKRIYVVILLAVLWTTGCQNMRQEVEPASLKQVSKKLVITGFISPQDTVLAIKVNVTRPVMDKQYTSNYGTVKNAKVVLKTGNRSIQLTYNGKLDYYQADPKKFPIKAGETYQLIAQTPEGLEASGRCTIPQPTHLQRVQLDSAEDSNRRKYYFVRYYWQDVAQTINYYQTNGVFVYTKSCPSCKADGGGKPTPETAAVLFESQGDRNTLLTDRNSDGKLLESSRGFLKQETTGLISGGQSSFSTVYERARVKATLWSVDEAYFNYHQALELQKKSEGNPFAEPVLLPSTIEGGLGCFAGCNQSSLIITFR